MNKKAQKVAALSLSALVGTGALVTSVDAASLTKNLKATYNNIRVIYDGETVKPNREPFLVDGTVYVSLRDAGQITGNGVVWADNAVHITPNGAGNNQMMLQKDMQIAILNKKVADLEAQLDNRDNDEKDKEDIEENKKETSTLKEVKRKIEDKYGSMNSDNLRIGWNIALEEKGQGVFLTLEYTTAGERDKFDDASLSKTESFLKSICEDIVDGLDKDIRGEIIDDVKGETVRGEFSYSNEGDFSYKAIKPSYSIDDLEDEIKGKYDDKVPYLVNQGDVLYRNRVDLESVKIRERSSSKYEFILDLDLTGAEKEDWTLQAKENRQANTRGLKEFMAEVRADIIDALDVAEENIEGYIYIDGKLEMEYKKGDLTIIY